MKNCKQILDSNKDISTEEIKKDILDTEAEIKVMKEELKGFRLLKDRMSYMRASSRRSGIKARKEFIEKLNILLECRGEKKWQ